MIERLHPNSKPCYAADQGQVPRLPYTAPLRWESTVLYLLTTLLPVASPASSKLSKARLICKDLV